MFNKKLLSFIFLICFLSMASFSVCVAVETESPQAAAAYNEGLKYFNENQYQKAVKSFQEAIKFDNNFADAYFNLALIFEHFDDLETAAKAYQQVILINPKDYEAFYRLALLHYAVGDDNAVLEYLSKIPINSAQYKKAQELKLKLNKSTVNNLNNNVIKQSNVQKPVHRYKNLEGRTATGGYLDKSKKLLSKYTSPTGMAVDSRGNMYVASFADNAIYKLDIDNNSSLFSHSPMIDGPVGIAVDSANNLYVANYNKDNILKITQSGNVYIYKSDVLKPYGLMIDNGILYVTEQGTNSVIQFEL